MMKLASSILLVFLSLITISLCYAEIDITLKWGHDNKTQISGYRIYKSTISSVYDKNNPEAVINDPNITTITVLNLPDNVYYFVATAFNANGIESDFSNEVSNPKPKRCIGD